MRKLQDLLGYDLAWILLVAKHLIVFSPDFKLVYKTPYAFNYNLILKYFKRY